MSKALLEIQNLHVRVEEKEILHGVDLAVGQDETHVLTLAMCVSARATRCRSRATTRGTTVRDR